MRIEGDWIESDGGPLVVLPKRCLAAWRGVRPRGQKEPSDYDRACGVSEWVGMIEVSGAKALVLGDEPLRTKWIPSDDGGAFVRWVYAESEEAVDEALKLEKLADLQPLEEAFECSGPCVIFDAAEDGADVQGRIGEVRLTTGVYKLSAGLVDITSNTRLLIVRLTRNSQ